MVSAPPLGRTSMLRKTYPLIDIFLRVAGFGISILGNPIVANSVYQFRPHREKHAAGLTSDSATPYHTLFRVKGVEICLMFDV